MKVLERGRDQKGWAKEAICTGDGFGGGGCGAKLLVEEADLHHRETGDGDGGHDYSIAFKCVECGVWTEFKTKDVPSAIWEKVEASGRQCPE